MVWTAGWGHVMRNDDWEKLVDGKAPIELCEEWFESDTYWAVQATNNLVSAPLSAYQFDAVVSLIFNVGLDAFRISITRQELNRLHFTSMAAEWISIRCASCSIATMGRRNWTRREPSSFGSASAGWW